MNAIAKFQDPAQTAARVVNLAPSDRLGPTAAWRGGPMGASAAYRIDALPTRLEDVFPALGLRHDAGARAPVGAGTVEDLLKAVDYLLKSVAACVAGAPASAPTTAALPDQTRYRFGKTWLDVAAGRLVDEDGTEVPLTAMEFNLLKLFARNRGRVLNRDQILEGAHDRSWDPFDRSIDIRISRVRKKIEVDPRKPVAIRTVRGLGYIYDPRPA